VIKRVCVETVCGCGEAMRKPERNLFRLFAGIVACGSVPVFDALAQSYPVKPIRIG